MNSLKFKHIMGMTLSVGLVAVGAMLAPFAIDVEGARPNEQLIAAAPTSCTSTIDLYKLGPALTVGEVEVESLKEMQSAPYAPQVPFGHSNDEWIALKALVKPGDKLHKFTTAITGGYLLARKECVVSQVTSWIR